jgi:hypothetical protein
LPPAAPMTTNDAKPAPRGAPDATDQFIPIRKSDVLHALIEKSPLDAAERDKFREFCRMLASVFHYEYYERLERLRESYFYFNPELGAQAHFDKATLDRAYGELTQSFAEVLKGANFVEVSQEEVERAHRESAVVRVTLETPLDEFREVRFYRRGHHVESVEISKWYGLRREQIDVEVYDDVILLVAMKSEEAPRPRWGFNRKRQRKIRPGSVLIKYFRNIASADLNALFPNVQIVMSLVDKLVLGVPAIAGGIPILFKLATTATVLFAVVGFYLGLSAAVRDEELTTALAALGAFVALGAFMTRQWVKYQRQSLMYHKQLSDNVYFRNVNNNAGIFDYMIGTAEDQECKEAFLAYHFLLTNKHDTTQAALDRQIEHWLKETFGVEVDFEVQDALAKLERLGLLSRDGETLKVIPLDQALELLDRQWDDYFQFNRARAREMSAAS